MDDDAERMVLDIMLTINDERVTITLPVNRANAMMGEMDDLQMDDDS
ncbi:MAG: hypothetical protein ACLFTK_10590 [Anaerolineales bacterium]